MFCGSCYFVTEIEMLDNPDTQFEMYHFLFTCSIGFIFLSYSEYSVVFADLYTTVERMKTI